jgi:hypothetical protein
MASNEERMKILQMLQEGRLSAENAAQLLQAVEETPVRTASPSPAASLTAVRSPQEGEVVSGSHPRWLRVRVTDTDTGRPRVNVRLPISLVNVGLKLGSKFAPEIEGVDFEELIRAANSGETGAFVDVFDEDDGEHVEVFLE